jgi:ESF2/ABP1 family protein
MEEEEASSSGAEFESKKEARSRKRRENHAEVVEEGGQAQDGAAEKKRRKKSLQDGRSGIPGKRGVVYLSRIPPHMKPLKLRHLLEPFGEVLRIYLAPEGELRSP